MSDLFDTPPYQPSQREAGEIGMEQAADHAEREHGGWRNEAFQYVRLFAKLNVGRDYLAEEIAPWADAKGCPPPPDKRAWGSIIKRAIKDHVIEPTGLAAKNQLSGNNSTWRPLYRSLQPQETPNVRH